MARICDVAGCGQTAKKVLVTIEVSAPDPDDPRSELGTEETRQSDLCERHFEMLDDHLRQLGFV